jgi:O-acetyl-ADP-ribose deacetylase (regulator of RNase III)
MNPVPVPSWPAAIALFAFAFGFLPESAYASPTSSPMSYVKVIKETPKFVRCEHPCVVYYDGAVIISGPRWNRYYVLHLDGEAINRGAKDRDEVERRAAAAVEAVLDREHAKMAKIQCGAAVSIPSLVGIRHGALQIDVPKSTDVATVAMTAMTAAATDGKWQKARRLIDTHCRSNEEKLPTFFNGIDVAKMTADTFSDPHLRAMADRCSISVEGGPSITSEATLLAIYSPESQRTYILDQSVKYDKKADAPDNEKRTEDAEVAILAKLRELGIKRIKIDADSLCFFPGLVSDDGMFEIHK